MATTVKNSVAAASLIAKAGPGNLHSVDVRSITASTAQQLMVFDSATVPADGTVTPVRVFDVPAAGSMSRAFNPPIRCGVGITFALSSTGPFSKTLAVAGNFALIAAEVS